MTDLHLNGQFTQKRKIVLLFTNTHVTSNLTVILPWDIKGENIFSVIEVKEEFKKIQKGS